MKSSVNDAEVVQLKDHDARKHVVDVRNLVFSYDREHPVLNIDAFWLKPGERLFIYGPSGCGKTTLLGLLAGVLEANQGSIKILGQDFRHMGRSARDAFRAVHIGYIFQMFNLLPYLSVLDNIVLPLSLNKLRRSKCQQSPKQAAQTLAEKLGLKAHLHKRSKELSVGQQQRVAAARALIGAPELVIADEPTSALDADTRRDFLELLFEQCKEASVTLLFVSHDRSLARLFDRSLDLAELNKVAAR